MHEYTKKDLMEGAEFEKDLSVAELIFTSQNIVS